MATPVKQEIAALEKLNEAISARLVDAEGDEYIRLVSTKALLSIASSLASINLYGIETSERS